MSYTRKPASRADASFFASRPYARNANASWQQDGPETVTGTLRAQLGTLAPPGLSVSAMGYAYQPEHYVVPLLAMPIRLRIGYIPPPITEPVILCKDSNEPDPQPGIVGGVLAVSVPPPELSLGLSARVQLEITGRAKARLPPLLPRVLSLSALAVTVTPGKIRAALTAPLALFEIQAEGRQNLDLPDADSASARPIHQRSAPKHATALSLLQQTGDPIRLPLEFVEQHGLSLGSGLNQHHTDTLHTQRVFSQHHQHGIPLDNGIRSNFAEATRTRQSIREAHQYGRKCGGGTRAPYAETIRRRRGLTLQEQQGSAAVRRLSVGQRDAWPAGTHIHLRWTHAERPRPGYWWPIYAPPGLHLVIPCSGDYIPRPLRCPVILGIGYEVQPPCPIQPGDSTIIVPIREVYYVINTFALTLIDGTPVPAADFSANIDADSWTWSWSARIPGHALTLVRPDPSTRVELLASINGELVRVLVESIQRERRFGESWLRVSGRGRAAFLADPFAPVIQHSNTAQMTARQCLEQALAENGVPIGWSIDWQIEDWQIPAGLWSHSGTWIDAAKRIAEAGGAYVQGHNAAETLRILPRYPVAPWSWADATPDIQLPEDVVEVEGIEWQEKPDYNAVWIHGGEQGRADRIIRTGSSSGRPAPTIVDSLATDPAMTRQRGLAVLGDTGKQALISLRLPILPETGLIHPGKLIEYVEQGNRRRGLVRSLAIAQNHPDLWQTIGVETHE